MPKILLALLIISINLFALNRLKPTIIYHANGSITDTVYNNSKIYVSTNNGIVNVIDLKSRKIVKEIKIAKIKDFMGDLIDNHISSIDVSNNIILIVTQAENGKNEVFTYKNRLKKIISFKSGISISKAKFINKDIFIFVTLDSTLHYYNLKQNKITNKLNVTDKDSTFNSRFSDFAFNDDKTKIALADESGIIKIVDLKQNTIIGSLKDGNLDNVFDLMWRGDIIITGGKDKKSVIYNLSTNSKRVIESDFFVYGVAVSDNLKLGAYSIDSSNNIIIFKLNNLKKIYKLTNNNKSIVSIRFIGNNGVLVSTDSKNINYYKLK
jgi:WD40 repeat protein